MSYFIRWYQRQIRRKNGLIYIVPGVCFLVGVTSHYANVSALGSFFVMLVAIFAPFISFNDREYFTGVLLIFEAFGGQWSAELLILFPRTFSSIVAIVGITILINPRFRKWRAQKIAFKNLNVS